MGMIFGKVDVERAAFESVVKTDAYEVRRYAPAVAVQVTMRSEAENNKAFGRLARYIGVFGRPENEAGGAAPAKVAMTAPVVNVRAKAATEKVAMTAPVVNVEGKGGEETMQFILPAKYTMETAPTPTSEGVELVQLPERTYVVLQYSGRTTMEDAAKRVKELAESLADHQDMKLDVDDWELYRYNPPFTLPFLRTNEIAVRVVV